MMTTSDAVKKLGIYVHIPFCVRKCQYCGFLSFDRYHSNMEGRYFSALFSEMKRQGTEYREYEVDTIFIGGGTPTVVPAERIEQVIEGVKQSFNVCDNAEITMESNPGTVTRQSLAQYRKAGVNRLSIGVQSFRDEILRALGRMHTAEEAKNAFRMAREAGFENINLDLMFSIPGLTEEIWEQTLREAAALSPEHLSFYSLQLEEGTEFYRLYKEGRLEIADDETDRRMYHTAVRLLKETGYCHYEISNAARPGFECRHNLKYWSMEDYLGLGLGASSFTGNCRFANPSDLDRYESRYADPENHQTALPREGVCPNSEADSVFEYVFTGLRKTAGIDLSDFERRFGKPFETYYGKLLPYLDRLEREGMICREQGRLAFTLAGLDISNGILSEFAEPEIAERKPDSAG